MLAGRFDSAYDRCGRKQREAVLSVSVFAIKDADQVDRLFVVTIKDTTTPYAPTPSRRRDVSEFFGIKMRMIWMLLQKFQFADCRFPNRLRHCLPIFFE
jgi:hypothetical protein